MRWPIVVFAVAAAACLIAHVAILGSVIRRASRVVNSEVPKPRFAAELLWAILPALILAFVLTASWQRVRQHSEPTPAELFKVAR